jgi:hypothetical protein
VPTSCVGVAASDRPESGALGTGVAVVYDETREGRSEAVRLIAVLRKAEVALTLNTTAGLGLAIAANAAARVYLAAFRWGWRCWLENFLSHDRDLEGVWVIAVERLTLVSLVGGAAALLRSVASDETRCVTRP